MKKPILLAIKTGVKVAKIGCKAMQVQPMAAARDEFKNAKRAIRKGCYAASDLVDQARFAIKRQPIKAVGLTFGIALGVGALAAWIGAHNREYA